MPPKTPEKKPGKAPDKKAASPAPAKAAAKEPAKSALKAEPKPTAPTAQSEKMRALYEKLHGVQGQGVAPGQSVPGRKKAFDPHAFHGQGKGQHHASMIRRTQSRGGGSGGGGGGGGGGGA
jgi:hypothetical protein